jgi:hypothetical protein
MRRGILREQDLAMFDQLQSTAIDAIREHKVWFLLAVDEHMECTLAIACPERVISDEIDGEQLYRLLLHGVIGAATDALVESIDEEEE